MTRGSRFGMISTLSLRNDWAPSDMTPSLLWLALLPHFGSRGDFPLVISEWKSFFLSFQKESFRQKSLSFYPRFQSPTFCLIFWKKVGLPKWKNHLKKASELLSFRKKNHLLGFGSRKSFRTVNHRCRTIFFGFQPAFTLRLTSLTPLHPLFW